MQVRPQLELHDGYRSPFRFAHKRGESVQQFTECFILDWLSGRRREMDTNTLDRWDGKASITLPGDAPIVRVGLENKQSNTTAVRYRITAQGDTGHYRVAVTAACRACKGRCRGRRVPVGQLVEQIPARPHRLLLPRHGRGWSNRLRGG